MVGWLEESLVLDLGQLGALTFGDLLDLNLLERNRWIAHTVQILVDQIFGQWLLEIAEVEGREWRMVVFVDLLGVVRQTRVRDSDVAVGRAWDRGSLNEQNVVFGVDAPDLETFLHSPLAAHAAGHLGSLDGLSVLFSRSVRRRV